MKFLPVLLSTALFAQSPTQNKKPEIREIRATGCVRKAPNGCLILKTLDGKTTYTFMTAPKPDSETVITIQGKSHEGPTSCKQGIVIDVTDWQPTGEKCIE